MKKNSLILFLILVIILVGCYKEDETALSSAEEIEDSTAGEVIDTDPEMFNSAPIEVDFFEGNGSGVWYMLSNGISECVNMNYEGSLFNITPGTTNTNLIRLHDYGADMGFTHSNLAYVASIGKDDYIEKHDNIRAVATIYPSESQFILLKSLGISSVDEFFEKKPPVRLGIGSVGSGSEYGFIKLIEAYGYSIEEMEAWGCEILSKGMTDSSKMLSDGALDGFFLLAGVPTPRVVESATNKDLVLLVINEEILDKLVQEEGYSKAVISSGTYHFQEMDIASFVSYSFLAATDQTSDEKVYKVLKSMAENLDYIQAIHSSVKDLDVEYMFSNQTIPMHPGAEQYYKEIGLIE